ncbi:MAG: hypothetical protein B7Z73_00630 [Planctomycetia bacterium 21-64-5]|nr:MAG: hypothetical protein B7Z73_00630 [Planctomycetia bacterium 21-64-5]
MAATAFDEECELRETLTKVEALPSSRTMNEADDIAPASSGSRVTKDQSMVIRLHDEAARRIAICGV